MIKKAYGSGFDGDTFIMTHRGFVSIKDVVVNDMVFVDREYVKVLDTRFVYATGEYILKVQGAPEIKALGNTLFVVRDKTNNGLSSVRYKKLCDFNGDEYVRFPVNKEDRNHYFLDETDCYLIGRYVADGYLRDEPGRGNSSNDKAVCFCIGKHKAADFEKMSKDYLMHCVHEETENRYTCRDKKLFVLCQQCKGNAENKIIPSWIMALPSELLKCFLDGYLSGDGCYYRNRYHATTVSKYLAYQLVQCVAKVYHVGSSVARINEDGEIVNIRGRNCKRKARYHIGFSIEGKAPQCKFQDGDLWMPVRDIKHNPRKMLLAYSLDVDGCSNIQGSYTTGGLCVCENHDETYVV